VKPPFIPLASRREVVAFAALAATSSRLLARPRRRIHAIAFDAFVLFNPGIILERMRAIAGERAEPFFATAQMKLFAYTWYFTSAGRYEGFASLANAAFRSAARIQGIDLSDADCRRLVEAYSELTVWPDVPAALQALRKSGVRIALLSNLSEADLRSGLRRDGIENEFEFVLSTDRIQKFKPAPSAYALAIQAFGLRRDQIGFAASAAWDAAGATSFGYSSVWVNRSTAFPEPAFRSPELVADGMDGVLRLARL
jgi:2-haloacid dehalogenase